MKAVIQRVSSASVLVEKNVAGEIGQGLLVFLGVEAGDTKEQAQKLAGKIAKLRIFTDENQKTNLSSEDIGGELLVVSQFTLCADCRKGNRPSFVNAAPPDIAEEIYEYFINVCKPKFKKVQSGVFGAAMTVSIVNEGPFTLVIEGKNT
ncbi:MAG: D-aminoacyl-tRNA deacylase [Firmicutes bacterium]|nr:D-aminoacyl-tRNA deacylase [Bacillota bacterium]